jgi:hypothetical protein
MKHSCRFCVEPGAHKPAAAIVSMNQAVIFVPGVHLAMIRCLLNCPSPCNLCNLWQTSIKLKMYAEYEVCNSRVGWY